MYVAKDRGWQGLAGAGRSGRVWPGLAEAGRGWQGLARAGRIERAGRSWRELAGAGKGWQGLARAGRGWQGLDLWVCASKINDSIAEIGLQ